MKFIPVLKPWKHQVAAGKLLRRSSVFALIMGMRTGKTKTTIDDWAEKILAGDCQCLLLIAPAGVYETWVTQLRDHLPPWLFKTIDIGIWRSGGKKAERVEMEKILLPHKTRPRVLLVNVEALSKKEGAFEACEKFLSSGVTMMVIDESTAIKNPTAKRTKNIWALGSTAKYRRILSGLITPRSPLDLFAQFYFLDWQILGYEKYRSFMFRYAIIRKMNFGGRRDAEVVVGYKNLEELAEKIKPHSFRIELKDCSDTPPKQYLTRYVELTLEQTKHYQELKKKATTQLGTGEHVTATEIIVRMLRLHQLCCGHLVDEEGVTHDVPTNRPAELMGLLEEYTGKAVIWCSYDRDIRMVSEMLRKKYGEKAVAQFWGGNRKTREKDNARFKTDPTCLYMVATPGAGGRGRTWSEAELIVYYSNTDNLEHRDQSEERASGVDKSDRVTVFDFITKGTVETKIVKNLRNKIDMAGIITGDSYREWII